MKRFLIPAGLFLAPAMVLAQGGGGGGLADFLGVIIDLINGVLVPLVIALAVLIFIWGVLVYVLAKSDDAKEKGRDYMIWGIIGLFVIVSVWGLVNVLGGTFGLDLGAPPIPDAIETR